jgi:hypothetical protein
MGDMLTLIEKARRTSMLIKWPRCRKKSAAWILLWTIFWTDEPG